MTAPDTLPISVVIPAFNAERVIGRAIASIKAQTRAAGEIVVVDDGSTDGTAAAARNAGARVLRQLNRGSGEARNSGVRAARYPWIAFLDADDAWLPARLEVQWPAVQRSPDARLICADFDYVSEVSGVRRPNYMRSQPAYRNARRTKIAPNTSLIERGDAGRALVNGNFVGTSTLLVAAELILNDGFFLARSELRSTELCEEAEDAEWLLRVLRRTDLLAIERSLGTYFAQPGSVSESVGRMRYGDVKLGERILADPRRYVAGIERQIVRVREPRQREAALEFLRSGKSGHALAVAEEAYAEHHSIACGALLFATRLLGTGAGRAAREATRSVWKSRRVLLDESARRPRA